MNTYYILLVSFLIQLSLKYGKAQVVTKDAKCVNGEKIQYGHHFECQCPADWVHETPEKCIKKSDLIACSDATTADKPCGDFAVCKKESSTDKYVCTCIENYTDSLKLKSLKTADTVCLPTLCEGTDCGNGVCRLGSNNKALCSCKLTFGRDTEGTPTSACNKTNEAKFKCDLDCPEPSTCLENEAGYMHCRCEDGKPIINGVCSSNAYKLFLSPLNIIFVLVISFISLKSA